MREGIDVMADGVVVHAADRPDLIWQRLYVSVAGARCVMNLDYAPRGTRCGEVEGWAQSWSTLIDSLDDTGTLAPDGHITVTYEDSFGELITRTHRFPWPDVDPWLARER